MTERGGVLVVEDDAHIAEILVDVLGDEGYRVRRSANGREALDALAGWVPDLIVLDLMMPVLDGWSFRAAQRRLPGRASRVPVVVLTGARDAGVQASALAAAAVISKPFDLDDVVHTVEQLARGQPA